MFNIVSAVAPVVCGEFVASVVPMHLVGSAESCHLGLREPARPATPAGPAVPHEHTGRHMQKWSI